MNLTHRQFEILIAAADAESFSAAAHRLGISQPSLSDRSAASSARSERDCSNAPPFLKLTPKAEPLRRSRAKTVRDFKRALDRLASPSEDRQGRITIAALPSIACAALPAGDGGFRREHPGDRVVVHDIQHERALLLVTEGTADIAVTLKPAHTAISYSRKSLRHRNLVAGATIASPAAEAGAVARPERPCFIGFTRISSVRRITDAAFVHAEIAIEPRYEVEQIPDRDRPGRGRTWSDRAPSLTFSMFKGRNLAVVRGPTAAAPHVGFVTFAGRTMPKHCDALMRAVRQSLLHELRGQRLRA